MEKARSMKPKSIKSILSDYLKRSNFREINETINLNASWEAVAGTPIFKNTEIISFKKGKLTIKTSNPVWRNELSFQKEELLSRLQQAEPEIIIKQLTFI